MDGYSWKHFLLKGQTFWGGFQKTFFINRGWFHSKGYFRRIYFL